MRGIIDFHSHILPGIDDGSRDMAESLALLRMEAEQGIGCVVATPHFYARHDNLDRFLGKRRKAMEILREALEDCAGLPEVIPGTEVHYFAGISDSEAVKALTIGGGNHILIEMPRVPWTDSMYRELERLQVKQGLIPIIAHVERYLGVFGNAGILKRLADLPVLMQANADFFLDRKTARQALRMLEKGQIHLLGSDCHNLTSRSPNLGKTLELIMARLGKDPVDRIELCQHDVLSGIKYEKTTVAWE